MWPRQRTEIGPTLNCITFAISNGSRGLTASKLLWKNVSKIFITISFCAQIDFLKIFTLVMMEKSGCLYLIYFLLEISLFLPSTYFIN